MLTLEVCSWNGLPVLLTFFKCSLGQGPDACQLLTSLTGYAVVATAKNQLLRAFFCAKISVFFFYMFFSHALRRSRPTFWHFFAKHRLTARGLRVQKVGNLLTPWRKSGWIMGVRPCPSMARTEGRGAFPPRPSGGTLLETWQCPRMRIWESSVCEWGERWWSGCSCTENKWKKWGDRERGSALPVEVHGSSLLSFILQAGRSGAWHGPLLQAAKLAASPVLSMQPRCWNDNDSIHGGGRGKRLWICSGVFLSFFFFPLL